MKINNLTNGLVATLLLASPIVGAETEYPAADFKPKVIYQDTGSSQAKSASATVAVKEKAVEVDAKYPAADFEPKVLYKDADYKPSKNSSSSSSATIAVASEAEETVSAVKAKDESMMSYLVGLAVFAVVGFLFVNKRDQTGSKGAGSEDYTKHASGLSGVARYLKKHNMSPTGVARYLEKQVESARSSKASSVEKYLEKQAKSEKEKALQAGTGVEKYMRNRG